MALYDVVTAQRGSKRHVSGLDGNTCPTIKARSAYTFWRMGEHTSVRDMLAAMLRPTCRYCVAAAERAVANGTE